METKNLCDWHSDGTLVLSKQNLACFAMAPSDLSNREIAHLLLLGDKDFDPSLQCSLNINEYSEKLSQHANSLLLYINDEIAGNVFYYVNHILHFIYITHINVYQKFRHGGYGHILIQQIKNMYSTHFNCIDLEVRKDNIYAYQFYLREGFVIKEHRSEKYLMTLLLPR